MSVHNEPAVRQIDPAEYDGIKNEAVNMKHDDMLDEFVHLKIRENELEGQVKYLNDLIISERRKAIFTHDNLTKEQSLDIQKRWTEKLKEDR